LPDLSAAAPSIDAAFCVTAGFCADAEEDGAADFAVRAVVWSLDGEGCPEAACWEAGASARTAAAVSAEPCVCELGCGCCEPPC
jgi:hypothetical protein